MSMLNVEIDNSEIRQYEAGITFGNIIKDVFGRKSGSVAVLVNDIEKDMSQPLETDCKIEPIYGESEAGLYILRHSCAHLLAQAVTELFPDAKPTIGPPIDHGFYYDFYMDSIGDEELKRIEERMREIMKQNQPISREEHNNESLREIFIDNQFKIEIIDEKIGHETGSSIYKQGNFVDLCRGPHVSFTSQLRWFKLTSTSQAYWRADSKKESLTRIYGMCFATKEGLKNREKQLQEASKRDHKKIGKEMELYMIDELIGRGLPVWLPNG